jgi:hypothetical protein
MCDNFSYQLVLKTCFAGLHSVCCRSCISKGSWLDHKYYQWFLSYKYYTELIIRFPITCINSTSHQTVIFCYFIRYHLVCLSYKSKFGLVQSHSSNLFLISQIISNNKFHSKTWNPISIKE